MLKLSKCGKLVKRRIPFDLKKMDSNKVDQCTVYLENFPESLKLEDIAKIFSRAGEIRNITLPKFGKSESAMDTDESVSLSKGFCFIEFDSKESAKQAVSIFNNCIPEELTNASHKNYVGDRDKVCQLNVMSKASWKLFKEEARLIKQEIARLNSTSMFTSGEKARYDGFIKGTLLRFNHRLGNTMLTKRNLREVLRHFGMVAYVDLHGKAMKQALIRFASKVHTQDFLAKAANNDSPETDFLSSGGNSEFEANQAFKSVLVSLS